ncbi:MAG: hypothetical protein ACRDDY_16205 [Clostridium sp.]
MQIKDYANFLNQLKTNGIQISKLRIIDIQESIKLYKLLGA